MIEFAESLIATVFFGSNIYFWQEAGYWGVENELKPLLHTWSLAVEEQFYIFFPILLVAIFKLKKYLLQSIIIFVGVGRFLLAIWATEVHPMANFFLLPTRAWELIVGALIAVYFYRNKKEYHQIDNNKFTNEVLSVLGMLAILIAVFFYDEHTKFPGLSALLPTMGAAFIILFATKGTVVNMVLSSRAMVGIGLISYSAYLWHQPLFAFFRHRSPTEPHSFEFLGLIFLALFLAFLSWKYVEAPFRDKKRFTRRFIFTFSLIMGGILVAVSVGIIKSEGLQQRFDPRFVEKVESTRQFSHLESSCLEGREVNRH